MVMVVAHRLKTKNTFFHNSNKPGTGIKDNVSFKQLCSRVFRSVGEFSVDSVYPTLCSSLDLSALSFHLK